MMRMSSTTVSEHGAPEPIAKRTLPANPFRQVLLELQAAALLPGAARLALIRVCCPGVGRDAFVERSVTIVSGPLELAGRSYVNRGCFLDCRGGLRVGVNTLIGPRVSLLTATHEIQAAYPRAGPVKYAPIVIGNHAWIGAGTTVLAGSIIGDGCVVAAGALVRGQLDADTLYAGVPARPVRLLPVSSAPSPDSL